MPKLVWVTDPHFNFISQRQFNAFVNGIEAHRPDVVLVGGDIAEAASVEPALRMMADALGRPIYFVLGNHDYYGASIQDVRRRLRAALRDHRRLTWLNDAGVVCLSPTTAPIGHDGWSDGRLGDYARSTVWLNDYLLIDELAGLDERQRLAALNRLGDEAADHLRAVLPAALDRHRRAILLTHVPPFRQACWHQGQVSNDDWLPHMACKAVGDAIEPIMRDRPDRQLTVLCGHTHSGGEVHIRDNLHVITGAAEYESPAVAWVCKSGTSSIVASPC